MQRIPALETLESREYEFGDDDIEYWADRSDWNRLRTLKLFEVSMTSALASGFLIRAAQKMTALTALEMSLPDAVPVGSSTSTSNPNVDPSAVSATLVAVQNTLMDLTLSGDYYPHLHAIAQCQELRMLSLHMLEGEERRMMTNNELMMVGTGCTKLEEVCVDLDPEVRVAAPDDDHYDEQAVRAKYHPSLPHRQGLIRFTHITTIGQWLCAAESHSMGAFLPLCNRTTLPL